MVKLVRHAAPPTTTFAASHTHPPDARPWPRLQVHCQLHTQLEGTKGVRQTVEHADSGGGKRKREGAPRSQTWVVVGDKRRRLTTEDGWGHKKMNATHATRKTERARSTARCLCGPW